MAVRKSPISVLCVEDSDAVTEAVKIILNRAEFEFAGRLRRADKLFAKVRERRPDIVLLDIGLPGADPFVAMGKVSGSFPESRVVVFTGLERGEYIERAFDCGAWGYISKQDPGEIIRDGLRRVDAGEVVMSPAIRAAL